MNSCLKLLQEKQVRSPSAWGAAGRLVSTQRRASPGRGLRLSVSAALWAQARNPDACLPLLFAVPQVCSESALPLVKGPKDGFKTQIPGPNPEPRRQTGLARPPRQRPGDA